MIKHLALCAVIPNLLAAVAEGHPAIAPTKSVTPTKLAPRTARENPSLPSVTATTGAATNPTASRAATGDVLFAQRGDPEKLRQALDIYRTNFEKNPGSSEAAWRVAMGCYAVGARVETDDDRRKALFEEGRAAGRISLALAEESKTPCAPCHFWTGINLGLYANEVGKLKMLFMIEGMKEHAQKTIVIDPTYANGGAHRLLGQIEHGLPGILGGSDKRARKHFEDAINAAPDEPMNYYVLADLLFEEFDDPKAALAIAEQGLSLAALPPDRVEGREHVPRLQKLAEKIATELADE